METEESKNVWGMSVGRMSRRFATIFADREHDVTLTDIKQESVLV